MNRHTIFQFNETFSLTVGEIRIRFKLQSMMNNQIHTDMIFSMANNSHGLTNTHAFIPLKDHLDWHKNETLMNKINWQTKYLTPLMICRRRFQIMTISNYRQ